MKQVFFIEKLLPARKAEGEEAEMGIKWVRKAVFVIPYERYDNEFVVTMYDDDAHLFLREDDKVVATLSFQGYIEGDECHQTIIASKIQKLD